MATIKALIFLKTHSHAKMAPDSGSNSLSVRSKKYWDLS
jgi:hypothetical protein